MSTNTENGAIMELIKNLFKKIFGFDFGSSDPVKQRQQADDISGKLQNLSKTLDEEAHRADSEDNFIKKLMLIRQKCCVDGMIETLDKVANKEISPKNSDQLHSIATELTHEKIDLVMNSQEILDDLSDYHNHDPVLIQEAARQVNSIVVSKNKELEFGKTSNTLNTIMRKENQHTENYLKRSPESHSQAIGQDMSNDEILNERDQIMTNQKLFNEELEKDQELSKISGYSS